MRIEGDKVTLSTGKTFDANMGIIGIGISERFDEQMQLVISEGSDFPLDIELTKEEKQEIGQFMLERWAQWARIELPRWPD